MIDSVRFLSPWTIGLAGMKPCVILGEKRYVMVIYSSLHVRAVGLSLGGKRGVGVGTETHNMARLKIKRLALFTCARKLNG